MAHERRGKRSGGGSMMSMRRGLRGLVGGSKGKRPQTPLARALDIGLWVVLALALAWVVYRRFGGQ